jgi:hypothetical protein
LIVFIDIRKLVRDGHIEKAMRMVFDKYPDVFSPESEKGQNVLFLCRCQQFIELIRAVDSSICLEFLGRNLSLFHKPDALGVDQALLKVNETSKKIIIIKDFIIQSLCRML